MDSLSYYCVCACKYVQFRSYYAEVIDSSSPIHLTSPSDRNFLSPYLDKEGEKLTPREAQRLVELIECAAMQRYSINKKHAEKYAATVIDGIVQALLAGGDMAMIQFKPDGSIDFTRYAVERK